MSEQLRYVRTLLGEIEEGQLAKGRAQAALEALDKYEQSLVRIGGVQEAYEALEGGQTFVVEASGGSEAHVCVVGDRLHLGAYGEAQEPFGADAQQTRRLIAGLLGALKRLEEVE